MDCQVVVPEGLEPSLRPHLERPEYKSVVLPLHHGTKVTPAGFEPATNGVEIRYSESN